MKATIDVPDDLYRRLKARAALQGRAVREVTIMLYRQWLGEEPASEVASRDWLDQWTAQADEALRHAPAGPTARAHLEDDRNRLER